MEHTNPIIRYFLEEKGLSELVARKLTASLEKYDDIKSAFLTWLKTRDYRSTEGFTVGGYSAADISNMAPFLDGSGVYNFMVTLRDNSAEAKLIIERHFPRR